MHLQVFVIFNLPSYSFSLIHLYQEPFSILYFFSTIPPGFARVRNADAKPSTRAYLCALEVGFSQVTKNCHVFCQTVGGVFLMFLPKIKDANSIWQTVEDALKKQWSYIYYEA